MDWRKYTKIFIYVALAVIVGYDITVAIVGGGRATISFVLLAWDRDFPYVGMAFAFLCGHLFWPQRINVVALVLLAALVMSSCAHAPPPVVERQTCPSQPSLAEAVVVICSEQAKWSAALLQQSEIKLRDCLRENERSLAYCLHELCESVWPEVEPL